jgi:hypothetical protein
MHGAGNPATFRNGRGRRRHGSPSAQPVMAAQPKRPGQATPGTRIRCDSVPVRGARTAAPRRYPLAGIWLPHHVRIVAGQRGGGCEIRTSEGLPPTRFPTLLASVHQCPPPFMASADRFRVACGELPWTGANEPGTEPSGRSAGRPWSADHPETGSMRSSCRISSSSWDARYRSSASWPLSQNCGLEPSALASRGAVEGVMPRLPFMISFSRT